MNHARQEIIEITVRRIAREEAARAVQRPDGFEHNEIADYIHVLRETGVTEEELRPLVATYNRRWRRYVNGARLKLAVLAEQHFILHGGGDREAVAA